jgi:hypothetical protein
VPIFFSGFRRKRAAFAGGHCRAALIWRVRVQRCVHQSWFVFYKYWCLCLCLSVSVCVCLCLCLTVPLSVPLSVSSSCSFGCRCNAGQQRKVRDSRSSEQYLIRTDGQRLWRSGAKASTAVRHSHHRICAPTFSTWASETWFVLSSTPLSFRARHSPLFCMQNAQFAPIHDQYEPSRPLPSPRTFIATATPRSGSRKPMRSRRAMKWYLYDVYVLSN